MDAQRAEEAGENLRGVCGVRPVGVQVREELPIREALCQTVRGVDGERGLADTRHPGYRDHAGGPRGLAGQRADDEGEVAPAPGEVRQVGWKQAGSGLVPDGCVRRSVQQSEIGLDEWG